MNQHCDCDERVDVVFRSWNQFQELKAFFEEEARNGRMVDIPVEKPYYTGHGNGYDLEWYADKWYRCTVCGTVWEFVYPEFPSKGGVRRLHYGKRNE